MATPAIEFMQLTRDFGARRAVDSLTFEVQQGEIFGFLGRNGAGKTTTIRCLLGLARPSAGDAKIHGKSIVTQPLAALAGVGALVETAAVYDYLSAADHLRASAYLIGGGSDISDSRIQQLLNDVGLADRARDRVVTFSRGMKQRIALATALLGSPRVLVLDEPTDGLDPIGTLEIRKLLKKTRDAGATIFLSSHLLAEVEAACDRVAVIDGGKLRAIATVADLRREASLEEFFISVVESSSPA